MYAYFRGELIESSPEEAIVEVAGIAYHFLVSGRTSRELPGPGADVTLLAHLYVKEDLMQLFGFSDEEERQLFRLLLSISGVGPRLALAILSGLDVEEIQEAIMANMPERLVGITGVGKKTAARIILELRDRILKLQVHRKVRHASESPGSSLLDDALQALLTLGFSKNAALLAVRKAQETASCSEVEELVREALQHTRNH
ncbi:Holliday junction branch migration protein RuvA [Prosthecochloris sp. N3]|uniref:Holliday junction branch migration complex subunit RuvA n=1 Tax=Prosthecochloris ethylica TaxID=2743976 RepID=A0ABR9XS46_9CHLB|nr:Holliday junction branch migration protein RuvA [Prosthecochloris ethylica]MBF0586838.1 Holliday junction branch migration protein RuvA [Prosthecochloris ethylica]MBF0636814.1 Holliday junction branch migration protein RuvA [Prosthecochloris ethylica]NUK48030.1 Holliday junction branch migration protein RuvA [Prosthecochloris ethylica]